VKRAHSCRSTTDSQLCHTGPALLISRREVSCDRDTRNITIIIIIIINIIHLTFAFVSFRQTDRWRPCPPPDLSDFADDIFSFLAVLSHAASALRASDVKLVCAAHVFISFRVRSDPPVTLKTIIEFLFL